MSSSGQSHGDRSVCEQIATARAQRFTGLLECEVREQQRTLIFVDGELHLPASHPHAQRWRELLTVPTAPGAAKSMGSLLEQLADSLGGAARRASLAAGHWRLPAERVGPLPTAKLLRVAAGREPDAGTALIRRFGARRLVAELPAEASSWVWTPEELWVLERLRQPTRLAELRRDCPMPRERLESAVAGLVATGQVREEGVAPPAEEDDDLRDLVAGLGERIGASLTERPLEDDLAGFRYRIAALLANAGGLDHYELLGVDPDAGADEARSAFEELARLVHPANARRFEVPELVEALRFLFERATDAYRTLTDPGLRIAYRARLGLPPPALNDPDPAERAREVHELARRNFDRALAEEANGDYQSALILLEEVVRLEPTTERWLALGKLQARNPSWTARAIESYRTALALDPKSGAIRYVLGGLYERSGDTARALELYEGAAHGSAPHAAARSAVERLKAELAKTEAKGSGPRRLASIFRRS